MTDRMPSAWVVQEPEYHQKRQPISGFSLGYGVSGWVWKVCIRMGNTEFITRKPYKNRASAEKAMKRYL